MFVNSISPINNIFFNKKNNNLRNTPVEDTQKQLSFKRHNYEALFDKVYKTEINTLEMLSSRYHSLLKAIGFAGTQGTSFAKKLLDDAKNSGPQYFLGAHLACFSVKRLKPEFDSFMSSFKGNKVILASPDKKPLISVYSGDNIKRGWLFKTTDNDRREASITLYNPSDKRKMLFDMQFDNDGNGSCRFITGVKDVITSISEYHRVTTGNGNGVHMVKRRYTYDPIKNTATEKKYYTDGEEYSKLDYFLDEFGSLDNNITRSWIGIE